MTRDCHQLAAWTQFDIKMFCPLIVLIVVYILITAQQVIPVKYIKPVLSFNFNLKKDFKGETHHSKCRS